MGYKQCKKETEQALRLLPAHNKSTFWTRRGKLRQSTGEQADR